ncbi:MAG: 50S ribosomal protein L22 [Desulfurococcaceae archaeon]
MPVWKYSVKLNDESKIAKAVRFDIPVSIKYMREIAYTLKGMKLLDAIRFLEDVIKLKQPIPFRRYHGKLSHKKGLSDRFKWPIGRYPVKGAKYTLELLKNVLANAEFKGLDKNKLVIIHIAAHKGITLKRYMPRAFGRATPKYRRMTHVEIIVKEVG